MKKHGITNEHATLIFVEEIDDEKPLIKELQRMSVYSDIVGILNCAFIYKGMEAVPTVVIQLGTVLPPIVTNT